MKSNFKVFFCKVSDFRVFKKTQTELITTLNNFCFFTLPYNTYRVTYKELTKTALFAPFKVFFFKHIFVFKQFRLKRIFFQITNRMDKKSFINVLTASGKQLKQEGIFNTLFREFYKLFLYEEDRLFKSYPTYTTFLNYSKTTSAFFHSSFLLNFLANYLAPLFDLKISKISAKIRKRRKLLEKIKFDYVYVNVWKRRKWFITQIITLSWSFRNYKLLQRLFSALVHAILLWRTSNLQKLKVKIYSFVLTKKKNQISI